MGYDDHKQQAGQRSVSMAIVTCSDTRTPDNDESGKLIKRLLEEAEHTVGCYAIVSDDFQKIRDSLGAIGKRTDVQAIIFNGGTGVARRDNTFDAIQGMLTKQLPGFGEIFRMLSYQTIGSGAILSRATAGTLRVNVDGKDLWKVVFSIPGSLNAVDLALRKLILPELSHLVWETLR